MDSTWVKRLLRIQIYREAMQQLHGRVEMMDEALYYELFIWISWILIIAFNLVIAYLMENKVVLGYWAIRGLA